MKTTSLKLCALMVTCLVVMFCAWIPSKAQVISGDLVGTVTDPTGAGVPNVTVTATNTGTNIKTTTTTNAAGQYRFSNLPPGTYDVSASATGFNTATLKNVAVNLNATNTANLTLQVGTVTTSVEVVEAPAQIDTTTAQVQQTYDRKQAEDIPSASIGQGVLNLSLLQAGVTTSGGLGYGTGPSVGGQRPSSNNFMVEGVDNNSKTVTGPQLFVPNDDVAEFSLLENQYRAEYGYSAGGQFNTIIKTGTNEFHGMLYEYFRNRNLNALDQSFAREGILSQPRFDENRLGANIGGPIVKNKWFFFMGFEYNPLGQASTTGSAVYAPTAAGYAQLSAAPGVSATNLSILQKYATAPAVTPGAPTVTVGNVTVPTGILPISGPNYANGYYGVLSSDYNFSEKDQLRGRFLYNRGDTVDTGAELPVFYVIVPTRNYLATLAEYHTFSPNVINELRLNFSRQNQNFPGGNFTFPGLDQFPNLQFNDLGLQLGPNPVFPQYNINNLYQIADDLTWTRGKHTIKLGYEFRDYIAPNLFVQRSRGDYEYTTVANYLLDQVPDYIAARGLGNTTFYGDNIAHFAYLQDTWRVTDRLSLDLGLRYEWAQVPLGARQQSLNAIASVPGLINFKSPSSQNTGFGPRVGVAYTPDRNGNTVVRAGFGIVDDTIYDNIYITSAPPEFQTYLDITGTTGSNFLKNGGIPPTAQATGLLSAADARANTSSYIPNQVRPYTINWTFDVQHVFHKDYTFDIRYLGTRGVHLLIQEQIDRLNTPVTANRNIPTFLTAPSAAALASLPLTVGQLRPQSPFIDPQYRAAGFAGPITAFTPQGWSSYNGLALQLTRRFTNGLQLLGAYTWSHDIDNSTAALFSTYLTPRRPQDFGNLTAEKASSLLDRRHRVSLSMIYDVPYYKSSSSWFLKNIVGNWEIAPVYSYESPEYVTAQSGVDANLNGDSAPDRTIINVGGAANVGSGVYGLTANGTRVSPTASAAQVNQVVAWVAINPNARYIQAGPGAYANGGRNTLATRPIDNVDLNLLKRFSITERLSFQLSGEALNLFNHPQYIPGNINDVGLVAQNTPAALSLVRVTSPTFALPDQNFSSSPRTLQIVGKITW